VPSCYACTNLATTREHVPPACLFPEVKDAPGSTNFRQNLITVPSCEEHNLRKAGDDEYLLFVLTFNLPANATGKRQLATKVARAVGRRPALARSILREGESVLVIDDRTHEVYESDQINLDGERFERTLELIAKGLYFHHFGTRWEGPLKVTADFIAFPHEPNAAEISAQAAILALSAEDLFLGARAYGDNLDVFYYQIYELNQRLRCLMRLCFYGGCKATMFFGEIGG
jgi:hypothetical protein